MNRYLEKIAGMPGSFFESAKKESMESLSKNNPSSSNSGLRSGPNVSKSFQPKARFIQNRTGMNKSLIPQGRLPVK